MNAFLSFGNTLTHFLVIISFVLQTASGIFIQSGNQTTAVGLSVSKTAVLVDDLNGDSKLNPGEELEYKITVQNSGDEDALDVQLNDMFDSNLVWDGLFSSTPLSHPASLTTNEDTPITIDLTAADADGQHLTFQIITAPGHGNLGAITSSGTQSAQVLYTPNLDYVGNDTFSFRVMDEDFHASNTALVELEVIQVNDPPTADNQSVSTDEDTAMGITLTGSDPEGNGLTYAVLVNPGHGSLSGTAPNLTYTPNQNFNGTDSFTFTVNDGVQDSSVATVMITVNAVNDLPIADDQSLSTDEDTPFGITLTGSDPESSPLSFILLTGPANGNLSGSAPNLTYTPNENFYGSDSFTFKVNDGGLDSLPATISIVVNTVNDPPTANPQSLSTDEDTPFGITLTGSDPENDGLTYTITGNPSHGSLSGTAPNLTYTPDENYYGSDSFTFKVNDGSLDSLPATISISVIAVEDVPTADAQSLSTDEDTTLDIVLTGSDPEGSTLTFTVVSNPSHGVLSGTAPNLTYTPDENYFGSDSFTFKVNDGSLDSLPATISISVIAVNDLPIANPQTLTTDEDVNLDVTLTGSDPDLDSLSFTVVGTPVLGTLTGTAPNLTYVPNVNACGSDQFTFKVNDGTVDSALVVVDITITCINDAPTAGADSYTTMGNTPLYAGVALNGAIGITSVTTLLVNDADFIEGTSISINSVNTGSSSGSVTWNTNGSFVYTPQTGFSGTDTFTYQVCDQGTPLPPACATGTVTITVGPAVIWYVDASAAAGGDGSSTAPFQSLSPLNNDGVDPDKNGDLIYLYHSASAYSGPFVLETNQQLLGQGAALVALTQTLIPAGTAPTLSNPTGSGVTLATGGTIGGLNLTNFQTYAIVGNNFSGVLDLSTVTLGSANTHLFYFDGGAPQITINQTLNNTTGGIIKAQNLTTGTSFVFNQTVNGHTSITPDEYLFDFSNGVVGLDVHSAVVNDAGGVLRINGGLNGSSFVFDQTVTTSGGGIVCSSSAGITVDFNQPVFLGSSGTPIADTPALKLTSCSGSFDFSALNIYTSTKSAIDIQDSKTVTISDGIINTVNAADYGMRITGSSAGLTSVTASFSSVNISGTTRSSIEILGSYDLPTNYGTGDGLFVVQNGGGITINGGMITANADDGIDIRYSNGLILNNVTLSGNGTAGRFKVAAVKIIDLSGTTNAISNSIFTNFDTINAAAVSVINNAASADLLISNSSFSGAATQGSGVRALTINTGQLDLTVNNGSRFENIYGAAISMNSAGGSFNSLTVQNSTLINAPANGSNGISVQSIGLSAFNVNLSNNTMTNIAASPGLSAVMMYAGETSHMSALVNANTVTNLPYGGLSADFAQTAGGNASFLNLTNNTWGTAAAPIGKLSNENGLDFSFINNSRVNFTQNGDTVYMTGSSPLFAEEIRSVGLSQVVVDLDNNQFTQNQTSGFGAWRLVSENSSTSCAALDGNTFIQSSITPQYLIDQLDSSTLSVVNFATLSSRNTGTFGSIGTITDTGVCSPVVMDSASAKVAAREINPRLHTENTQLNLNIGTIPAGASVEIVFYVSLAVTTPYGTETVNNQAFVSGSNFDQIASDDPALPGNADRTDFPIDLPDLADLSLSQTLTSVTDPAVGDPLTWEITLTNAGPASSPSAVLKAGFTNGWIWDTVPQGCVLDQTVFTCTVPFLASGQTLTYVFETIIQPGVQSNNTFSGSVVGDVPDPNLLNNTITDYFSLNAWVEIPGETATGELPVAESPNGTEFFGEFGNEAVELSFTNLPPHTRMELTFDLIIIRSWDGTGENYQADVLNLDEKASFAPDLWQISVKDGGLLMFTSFANWPSKMQSYPNIYLAGSHPPKTGAEAINTYGYPAGRGGDATYHMTYPLVHTQDSVTFVLSAEGLEDLANESWGFTNVGLRLINMEDGNTIYLPLVLK